MFLNEQIKLLQSQFVEVIRDRLGINLQSYQNQELNKLILEACTKFHCTAEEYLILLKESANQSPVLNHLVKGITVGETYFFRDKQQMKLLEHTLLPKLIQKKRQQNDLSIRIWSAGCASGEEIYSLTMMLLELISDINKWNIKLLATDINTHSLQKALSGIYSEWSMRSINKFYKEKYFKKENNKYYLAKNVRDLVTFEYLNLNENNFPSIFNGTNSQDLIVCRNVLIYFDNDSCANLMKKFNASLISDGFLLLGASDPVHIAGLNYIFHHEEGLLFSKSDSIIQIPPLKPFIQPATILPKKIIPFPKKSQPKTLQSIPPKSLLEQALELANKGQLLEALSIFEKAFKLEPTNILNYLNHALTLLELNRLDEAESSLRKTLFLDNQFVVGHFQLGLLLIRKKQYRSGLKYLENALRICETKSPQTSVLGAQNLSYQKFAEILRNEIKLYLMTGTEHEIK